MENHRILIIIPAHNETASLAGVIADVRSHMDADIVVVDDGSSDGTDRVALEQGVQLLRLPFNLGIGSTMQAGFLFARQEGYDIAVQVDGDGQHDAGWLEKLLKPVIDDESDMTVGSRYLVDNGYDGSPGRRAGTALFSKILSLILRQKLTDATSGFRAINWKLIEQFANDYPRDYPEVEALLLVHMARYRIMEVPVQMRPRAGGRSSINFFRSVYYMVKVLLALAVVASRRHTPSQE
ncbi:MAG: glycosyltransferase family 2 protein [Thermoleophilia bacterium]|jgi:hypothetical protein